MHHHFHYGPLRVVGLLCRFRAQVPELASRKCSAKMIGTIAYTVAKDHLPLCPHCRTALAVDGTLRLDRCPARLCLHTDHKRRTRREHAGSVLAARDFLVRLSA